MLNTNRHPTKQGQSFPLPFTILAVDRDSENSSPALVLIRLSETQAPHRPMPKALMALLV